MDILGTVNNSSLKALAIQIVLFYLNAIEVILARVTSGSDGRGK
jgi:hypothetical protein